MLSLSEQNTLVQTFNAINTDLQNANNEETLADVENRVASLLGSLEQIKGQNEAFSESMANAKTDMEALKEPLNELEAAVTAFKEAIKNAQQEYDDEQEQLLALKKRVDEKIDLLKQQLETIQTDFGNKNNEVESIDNAFQEKKTALEMLTKMLEKVEEQLSKAELTDERRDSLTAVYQSIVSILEQARQAQEEVADQLAGISSMTADEVNSLIDRFNEIVSKFNSSPTKEELTDIEGLCESLRDQCGEVEKALATQRSSLSDMKEPIGNLLANADELSEAITKLAKGIEEAEKLTADELAQKEREEQEKKELEVLRQEMVLTLADVKSLTDESVAEAAKIKAEAQVLADESEVKQLLVKLSEVEKHLTDILADLQIQEKAINAATTKEELLSVNDVLDNYYKTDLPSIHSTLKNLHSQLQAVLTVVSQLTIDGKKVVGCYDTSGRPADIRKKGMKILRLSDGTTRKVYIK
jgi:chromosome segregation ATPase